MRLQSFKVIASLLVAAAITIGCGGGSPAPAPSGLTAVATESTVTLTWDTTPGVEYWVFYAPTVFAPKDNSNMSRWFNLPGGAVQLNATSPYVITGLANANSYSFTVNGRTGGGPGGPAATTVTATPRPAGGTWTNMAAATSQDLRGLTNDGTNFYAVGTGGTILSSANGSAWANATSPSSNTLNDITYFTSSTLSNGVITNSSSFLIVGDAGTLLFSSDAVTWTAKPTGTTNNLYAVANNGLNLNVAVGAQGTILTSTDGLIWTAATASGTTRDLFAVGYAAGSWYAAGANGTLVKSSDGLTWTAANTGSTVDFHGFTYGASTSTTAAVAYVLVGNDGTVLTSGDGVTWTSQVLPGASKLNAVIYGSQFVTAGNGGQVFTSTDGVTWTASLSGTPNNLLALARGVNMYAATGAAGTNLTSK